LSAARRHGRVDDEIELGRLLDRQVARARADEVIE
jgi:hypothetical protein